MAEYETILTGVEDGIGTITLNRPDVRNSLSSQVLKDLRAALDDFREDDGVGVVAFTGAGEKAFAAGADIGELRQRIFLDALASAMQAFCDEVEGYEKPTIAAVNGYALGGGCELAMGSKVSLSPGGGDRRRKGLRRWWEPHRDGYGNVQDLRAPRVFNRLGKG